MNWIGWVCWEPLKHSSGVHRSPMGVFIFVGEEGVESFKDFSFWSDPIGEVGVIIHIKETIAIQYLPSTVYRSQY